MNKTAIKNFAIWARVTLINAVTQMAFEYDVTENGRNDAAQESVNGRTLTLTEKTQRAQLISNIRQNGFAQTMEEAAYTWFNRFIALRFMEVNNYLPSHTRIFSDESGAFKPEVLDTAATLSITKKVDGVEVEQLDKELVLELLENQENERLYKYIIITQCNALNEGLSELFEGLGGWTELLFPRNLLREDSVIAHMVSDIPEDDWKDQVQIIGWLYQYYNSEKKDAVFAAMSNKVKVSKENIAAATQLFTPDWIVRYMVENSLGRLWVDGHADTSARSEWKYYLDEAEQTPEVQAQLAEIRAGRKDLTPEQIRFIDPCMGSGHILVYAFDVLMQIYLSCGYTERDAAQNIVRNNLWGLDLDKRAYQLAYFAVMMKARQYDRRFLTRGIKPNLSHFQDLPTPNYSLLDEPIKSFVEQFENADTYGSLITVNAECPYEIENDEIKNSDDVTSLWLNASQLKHFKRLYDILSQRYDVVCTNPPYMGSTNMNATLVNYLKSNYPDSKSDFFAAFIERGFTMAKYNGYNCMVTMQSWMFLSSYEAMRNKILVSKTISSLMHMENMVMGIAFGTAVTSFLNSFIKGFKGTYNQIKFNDIENDEPFEFPVKTNRFSQIPSDSFANIPSAPIAYWLSNQFVKAFDNTILSEIAKPRQGLATSDNNRFLKLWYEVDFDKIGFNVKSIDDQSKFNHKWFPCTKGGSYRRWYGNNDYIVDWEDDGREMKAYAASLYKSYTRTIKNISLYFQRGLSWSTISSGLFSLRYIDYGFIFETKGAMCFVSDDNECYYILGLMNTKIVQKLLEILAPTLDYHEGPVGRVPIIITKNKDVFDKVVFLVDDNIGLSKTDWDSFETSWDFKEHPFIRPVTTIKEAYEQWEQECNDRRAKLKANEEELNRIFIDIYDLQDELTPEVDDKDITVRAADLQRDMRSFVSYAVGCLFGRYSLDVKGLAYAGGEWDESKYKTIIPDKDNVLPICDDDYLPDDLTGLIVDFVAKVYGEDTLEENLKFIADALGGKGTPREVIRNYLLTGFFADHCKIYQKRPIYWLFSSGKKHAFKALVYMHRWERTTVATVRTDYVHELQERYRTQLSMLGEQMESAAPSDRVKLKKRHEKLTAQLDEINKYEEKVHHLADQMIDIDLDDGVKVNYAKFQDILEKIK